MALTSQQAAAGDSPKAASSHSGEDFGDLLHLYRSLYILSQDVDANLPRIGGPNDKYRQGQKERSLGALAVRYELQRMTKKGLRRFQGAEMLDTFRKRWKTLRKNVDFQFNDFWTHGSRACEVGKMHELRKAYGLASSRFPNLPEYPTAMAALTGPGSEAVTDADITLSSPTDESSVVVRPSIASKASLDHRVVSQNDQSEVAVSGSQPKDRTRNSEAAVVTGPCVASHRDDGVASKFANVEYSGTPNMFTVGLYTTPLHSQTPMAIEDVGKELKQISSLLTDSASALGRHLGLKLRSCPVTPEPNELLIQLYVRCWGDDWRSRCQHLLARNRRSVIDDTVTLISAFIFDNVLESEVPEWKCARRHPDDDPSHHGESSHVTQMYPTFIERRLDSVSTLCSGNAITCTPTYLNAYAQNLTAKLLIALDPYLTALTRLSHMMYISPRDPQLDDRAANAAFEASVSGAIRRAVLLKTNIKLSGIGSRYFWPESGATLDRWNMQSDCSVDWSVPGRHTVAFTKFPGARLRFADQNDSAAEIVCHAEVVPMYESVQES